MNRFGVATLASLLAVPETGAEGSTYTRNVAIVVYENAQPLDWTGPYEVYNDAARFGAVAGAPAFNVYIVSRTKAPLNLQGLTVIPTYSIADAPKPDIVMFPGGPSDRITNNPEFFAWAKKASREAEIAQSVCTGAFVLAKAGLLDGLEVTTFHGAIEDLQRSYPKAAVKSGRRFVDNGRVVTTAGISAGIDGSLHVVARLLGRRIADQVANYMEYSWSPEATLATRYSYLNPSADERGRMGQIAEVQAESKNFEAAEATFRALLKDDPEDRDTWSNLAYVLQQRNDHAGAGDALARSADGAPAGRARHGYYDAAVEYAKAGRSEEAVAMLAKAFASGFSDRDAIEKDPNLAKLRTHPRVLPLLAEGR
jgi:transcriptional regulator GlxA family with amidase domain